MTESRSVVVTGASRGLGLATVAHLHRRGWTVVAAMRTVDAGLAKARDVLGNDYDPERLIGVSLDLLDPSSIEKAGSLILDAIGTPDGVVHNAGIAGVGCVEEMPLKVMEAMLATNFMGPIRLTRELLPAMRGRRTRSNCGRVQRERLARHARYQLLRRLQGCTRAVVRIPRRRDRALRPRRHRARDGHFQDRHPRTDPQLERPRRSLRPPPRAAGIETGPGPAPRTVAGLLAPSVERALDEHKPFERHAVGLDAKAMLYGGKVMPGRFMAWVATRALGLPRPDPSDSRPQAVLLSLRKTRPTRPRSELRDDGTAAS